VLILLLLLALLVLLKLIHTQVEHRQVALPCPIPQRNRWITSIAEPPLRVWLLLLGYRGKLRPTCLGKGIRKLRLVFLCQPYLGPIHPGGNGRAYTHSSSNYQVPYTTIAYTDPIPLHGSSLDLLPNQAYQNAPRFNGYGQPKAGGFGYETSQQFPFRQQLIDMTPARATVELGVDPNNLTNQLATI
jgi:hypothetical protein